MALLVGFLLIGALGIAHHYGLMAIRAIQPDPEERSQALVITTFLGLLTLHMAEILVFAAIYAGLLASGALGELSGEYNGTWNGLIYFSGINFATLGYTQIQTSGPIRMVNMMQSLGGFMVLTWSATFLYSACEQAWRKSAS